MRKKWMLGIMCFFMLTGGACSATPDTRETERITYGTDVPGKGIEADGVIEVMESDELITKLSGLKVGMTLEEMSTLFGKEPFTVKESDSDLYQYYSGDIVITLWGKELYQATIEYKDSYVRIALHSELPVKTVDSVEP